MTLRLKRGDTLNLDVMDDTIDLSATDIESAVQLGSFYEELTVSNIDAGAGTYSLSGDTRNWPLGSVDCDIKYTVSGDVIHTSTFQIMIIQAVTK